MSKDQLKAVIMAYGVACNSQNGLLIEWAGEKVEEAIGKLFEPQPEQPPQ
jgi:hypothetical protein